MYRGRGIERKALSVPAVTGLLIHEPLAEVLKFAREKPSAAKVEFAAIANRAVRGARERYLDIVRSRGLLIDSFDGSADEKLGTVETSPNAWLVNEGLALIEALVKGWTRVRLPQVLEEYAVVDVEQEQNFELSQGTVFMTRRDALLRRHSTGECYVLNFKSVSDPNATWRESFQYDTQTISEFVAADQSLRERGSDGVVRGVLIEGLVKGTRSIMWPEGSNQRRHNSPLLYHWATPDVPPMGRSYAVSAFYQCTEPHPHRWAKGGTCPGHKSHKLGEDYQRNMVSQTCGFDDWLDWMEEHEPELLKAQFVALPAIMRSEYDIKRWRVQTRSAVTNLSMRERGMDIARDVGTDMDQALDGCFPMKTAHQNCLRPSRCPYLELCFGAASPEDPELFVPRVFNHPGEEELLRDAGKAGPVAGPVLVK